MDIAPNEERASLMHMDPQTHTLMQTQGIANHRIYFSRATGSSISYGLAPLVPPVRFGCVAPGVYRGTTPQLRNHRFLKRLALRTAVALTADLPSPEWSQFCAHHNIKLIHLPPLSPTTVKDADAFPLDPAVAIRALNYIIDPQHAPLLIYCTDGAAMCAAVVGTLRKLQMWSWSSVAAEWARFMREGVLGGEGEEERFWKGVGGESTMATATGASGASSYVQTVHLAETVHDDGSCSYHVSNGMDMSDDDATFVTIPSPVAAWLWSQPRSIDETSSLPIIAALFIRAVQPVQPSPSPSPVAAPSSSPSSSRQISITYAHPNLRMRLHSEHIEAYLNTRSTTSTLLAPSPSMLVRGGGVGGSATRGSPAAIMMSASASPATSSALGRLLGQSSSMTGIGVSPPVLVMDNAMMSTALTASGKIGGSVSTTDATSSRATSTTGTGTPSVTSTSSRMLLHRPLALYPLTRMDDDDEEEEDGGTAHDADRHDRTRDNNGGNDDKKRRDVPAGGVVDNVDDDDQEEMSLTVQALALEGL